MTMAHCALYSSTRFSNSNCNKTFAGDQRRRDRVFGNFAQAPHGNIILTNGKVGLYVHEGRDDDFEGPTMVFDLNTQQYVYRSSFKRYLLCTTTCSLTLIWRVERLQPISCSIRNYCGSMIANVSNVTSTEPSTAKNC